MSYFAKYAAGQLPASALKSFIKQIQTQRQVKKDPGGRRWYWDARMPGWAGGVTVVASTEEEAINKAMKAMNYPDSMRRNLEVRAVGPYEEDT